MKKSKFALVCGALLVAAGTAFAANEIFNDKGEASIKIQEQDAGLIIDTTEVHYITDYLPPYAKQILVKVTTSLQINTGLEGSVGSSTIEVRSQKDNFVTPLWTVNEASQSVAVENDQLLRSVRYGCCGEFVRSTLYNVENGNSPATYLNEDFYTISVPNSSLGRRYLAQVEDPSAPSMRNSKKYIGSVAYFNDNQELGKVRFYALVPSGWGTQISEVELQSLAGSKSKNSFRGNELELWDADGSKDAKSAFKDFALSGTIDFANKHLTLQVPVSGDKIDSSRIKVSSGLEFEVLN